MSRPRPYLAAVTVLLAISAAPFAAQAQGSPSPAASQSAVPGAYDCAIRRQKLAEYRQLLANTRTHIQKEHAEYLAKQQAAKKRLDEAEAAYDRAQTPANRKAYDAALLDFRAASSWVQVTQTALAGGKGSSIGFFEEEIPRLEAEIQIFCLGVDPSEQRQASPSPGSSPSPQPPTPTDQSSTASGTTPPPSINPNNPPSPGPTESPTPTNVPASPDPSASPSPPEQLGDPSLEPSLSDPPSPAPSPGQRRAGIPGFAPLPVAPLRNPGELPPVWCVIQRTVTVTPGNTTTESSVARCDDVAGLGPDWTVVQSGLTFPQANQQRDGLNGSNLPNVWCVMRKLVPGTSTFEHTVIRCDNQAGAGPGWEPIATDLTFPQATAIAQGGGASPSPPPQPRTARPRPLPPPVIATGPAAGSGVGPAPGNISPLPPLPLPATPPTQPGGKTASAPLPPPTLPPPGHAGGTSTSGCQPSGQYRCIYQGIGADPKGGGPRGVSYVMSICVPPQGFAAATCKVDTVFAGETSVASSTTCDPPKDQASMVSQCKDLRGVLETPPKPATGMALQRLPVEPLPPPMLHAPPVSGHVAPVPVMPQHTSPPTYRRQAAIPQGHHAQPRVHVNRIGHPQPRQKWSNRTPSRHVNIYTPPTHRGSFTRPHGFAGHNQGTARLAGAGQRTFGRFNSGARTRTFINRRH